MHRPYPWFAYLIVWLLQIPLYLAFASDLDYRELLVSLPASAIATVAAIIYARRSKLEFRFKLAWLLQGLRVAPALLKDTWTLLVAVARRSTGHRVASSTVTIGFDCRDKRAHDSGQRALATTFLTLTPNTIVLNVCEKKPEMTFHELLPEPIPGFAIALGAKSKGGAC